MDNKKFAYGSNSVDGCKCPSVTALDKTVGVVDEYDKRLQSVDSYVDRGTVEEQEAKKAWLMAIWQEIDYAVTGNGDFPSVDNIEIAKDGIRVAKELGWI